MTSYQTPATFGLLGLLCVASPLIFKLPSQFRAFNASTSLEADTRVEQAYFRNREEFERIRIDQRQETAERLAQAGVLPNGQKLKIRRYFDNPKRNPNPDTTGWQEGEVVFVFDAAGACIGQIKNRQWYWKHHYRNVCAGVPAQ
ncbi:hypothetical protein [Calothrix sp. 336/3]|uniref:hypothetical protein n=1 Tax=Calothrix sp. 336/3 TaxID=1337936 RepID=UPI0004E3624D|nr:hypothetical protein [Calothrix sp. 336/3]AKG24912.1 hypothetical protein IJ00_26580 [Calothrix sp. 336/3]